ncbi:DUF262 domain-containing protein [Runella sp.]|uniref:DUF262 domain-containing protein n=1 Tax=Runella sp. TaxID=1960881 RepID=UPI003D0B5E6C
MKLKESIPSNGVKIIDLYNKIDSEILDTSPDFQRKLVWKKQHKYAFIETILFNYPFPEVYIASAEMDVESLKSKEIVVDGKQRLTAIVEYIKGINDFKDQSRITPFDNLSIDEKRSFLNYLVTVKDLKDMDMENIKDIFQRINSTEYALNAIERTNAIYGDGEFSVFCKQIVDSSYNPTHDETDIILDAGKKKELNDFFSKNNIFSENDKNRMFDVQYIMLIVSTFLEGDYYGRSAKVNEYLEKYNSSFGLYEVPFEMLLQSIRVIANLGLSDRSYWYNKANLFTLIIELSKINVADLNLEDLERNLLDLENKVDIHFSDDEDDKTITEDEKRYFEVARQGSHEKAARIHRGNVIRNILHKSLKVLGVKENKPVPIEKKRSEILLDMGVLFTTIIPTKTGLEKSIMDATFSIREFLKTNNIHNYEGQSYGPEYKVIKKARYILESSVEELEISLYRAHNRGDARIWLKNLGKKAKANDTIAIIYKNGNIYIINLTQLPIENLIGNINPFNSIIIENKIVLED